ncbi:hypothetical protein [Chryseobacterium sp.]|uniref:hypothetical protein n=1 Tax=Chryseobacterium sp. TaxID=1871047 RepID=UPI0011CA6BC4|nr:hypothetical protein [Chryseobacterium sp.]TXF75789.1 hypothetical protein FUA25_07735 [Chryseobacterium sp.]
MNKILTISLLFFTHLLFAQNIYLNKVVKTNANTDKFFYKITGSEKNAEYLGEIEVQGYSNNDVEVFSKIYKKAKQTGANAFSYALPETLDGKTAKFDPFHYKLKLYYLPSTEFPKEENTLYIISGNDEPQKIKLNDKSITLNSRSYIKRNLVLGEENELSAGKLLGSRIKLAAKAGQPALYFSVDSFNIKADDSGTSGGLNIKSGDIIVLEKSFANFLITVYEEQK